MQQLNKCVGLGKMLWNAGLPVLDDLHNTSYDWIIPADIASDDCKSWMNIKPQNILKP